MPGGRQRPRPDDLDLLNDLGLLLRDLKRPTEALAAFERALQLKPDFAEALTNRGLVLQELDRFDEALAAYDRSLQLRPDLADSHANRGNALQELGRHEEALAAYERALAIKPDHEAIYLNESLSRLVLGDLSGGWPKYEWRWRNNSELPPQRQFAEPLWLGRESLAGKTILIYAEQGLGDTIQFCRYAKPLAERGATVLLRVQPPLVPLLQGLDGVARLFAADEPPPRFDYHCPLLSLPLALDTTLQTIPAGGAYVRPAGPHFAERLDAWQARLGPHRTSHASAWSGRATCITRTTATARSRCRTSPASCRRAARFVALQNEIRDADAAVLKAARRHRLVRCGAGRFRRDRRARRPARPGDLGRHLGRPSRRGDGQAGVAAAAAESRLALAARPRRQSRGTRRCGSSARRGAASGAMSSPGSNRRSLGASPDSTSPGDRERSLRLARF